MDFELKAACILLISILFLTSFMPFGYALPEQEPAMQVQEPRSIIELTSRIHEGPSSGCDHVETVSMNWSDYLTLVRKVDREIDNFDFFGDSQKAEVERRRDEVDLPTDLSASPTKNEIFFNTEGKPVRVYDTIKHTAKSPEDACYMSSIVTHGRVSYATRIDKKTRFCAEYPDVKDCEGGYLTDDLREESIDNYNKIISIEQEADKESPDWGLIHQKLNELGVDVDPNDAALVEEDIINLDLFIDDWVAAAITKTGEHKDSPLNIVESNETWAYITQSDAVYHFPLEIASFVSQINKMTRDQRDWAIAGAAVSIGSLVIGLRTVKAWSILRKGGAEGGGLRHTGFWKNPFAKNYDTITESLETSLKNADDVTESENILKTRAILEGVSKEGKAADIQPRLVAALDEPVAGPKYSESLMDTYNQVDVRNIPQGSPLLGMSNAEIASDLGNPRSYHRTKQLLEELDDPALNKKLRKVEESASQLAGTEGRVADKVGTALAQIDPTTATTFVKTVIDDALAGSMGPYARAWKWVRELQKTGSWKAKAAARGFFFLISLPRGMRNTINIFRAQAFITLGALTLGRQPQPVYEFTNYILNLKPTTFLKEEDPSYFEIIQAKDEPWIKVDVNSPGFFTNLMNFYGLDFKDMFNVSQSKADVMNAKIQDIGDYVLIIDQELAAKNLHEKNIVNMIMPFEDESNTFNREKFLFYSLNPDYTQFYAFEHPSGYKLYENTKHTTLALVVVNVNISGISAGLKAKEDWATYGLGYMVNLLPNPEDMLLTGLTFSVFNSMGFFFAGVSVRGTWAAFQFIAQSEALRLGLGPQLTETVGGVAGQVREQQYGAIVDLEAAYNSPNNCATVRKDLADDLKRKFRWVKATTVLSATLDIIDAVAPGPLMIVTIPASLLAAYWNWKETDEFDREKVKAIDSMKDCYDTKFAVVGIQTIPTEGGTEGILQDALSSMLGTVESTIMGLAPELGEGLIGKVAENYHYNVLTLKGEFEGKSLVNVFGTDLYQVHFDREADIKWFSGPECRIQFCEELSDGTFKCPLEIEGYQIFDAEGNLQFTGPHAAFVRWYNGREYMGMPQKVIDVTKSDKELMDVYAYKVGVKDSCVTEEIYELLGVSDLPEVRTARVESAFDIFEIALTNTAFIWIEDTTVVARYTTQTTCGGEGRIARYDNAHLRLFEDGKLQIVGDASGDVLRCGEFNLGSDGFLSFTNGKIMPGRSARTVTRGERQYDSPDWSDKLHLAIYRITEADVDIMDDYWIGGECTDPDTGQKGFWLQVSIPDNGNLENQWNEMLGGSEWICFTGWKAQDGKGEMYVDNQTYYYVDAQNNTYIYTDPTYDSAEKVIYLDGEDGERYTASIQPAADGSPQFVIIGPDGRVVGNPLPLLNANGWGGSLNYDSNTGRISIDNEFAFPINPNFNNYGALMTPAGAFPGQAPWGSRVKETAGPGTIPGGVPQPNILAQLPWAPSGFELIIFLIILMSGIMLVRIRYRRIEVE